MPAESYDQLIIFVVGTGRSGTHWLGYTLDSHPDISTTVEDPKVFDLVTKSALDESTERRNVPKVLRYYRRKLKQARPRHYADKSHPNLWLADHLVEEFGPSARFLGIERSPYGVAASSLEHEGVSDWHRRWRDFPVPNRFLGITPELAERYDELTPVEQYAHRWLAHHEQMERLRERFPDQTLVLDYERMIDGFEAEVSRIWRFLGIDDVPVTLDVKSGSRDRWRASLSDDDVACIERVTGVAAPA